MKTILSKGKKVIWIVTFMIMAGVIGPDFISAGERFIENGNGTVTDTKTGLMWSASDNGVDVNFFDAEVSIMESTLAGYNDWRMPDKKELTQIYDPSRKNSQGLGITDKIKLSECCQWSSYDSSGGSSLIDFSNGKVVWMFKYDINQLRFLQVRDVK